ncbi:MAG TPA: hypothetical protein ENO20_05190 [Bacteroides sp.]|nr:hypothetical protein [Bacteroides sp.]
MDRDTQEVGAKVQITGSFFSMLAGLIIAAHVLIPHHHHFHDYDPQPAGQECYHGGTAESHVAPEEVPSHCHFLNNFVFAREDDQHTDLQPGTFAIVLSLDLTVVPEEKTGVNPIIPLEFRIPLPVGYILEDSPLRAPPGIC